MNVFEIEDIIRDNINKKALINLFVEKEKPIISFNTEACNRIFITDGTLLLESEMYKDVVIVNLRASERIVVHELD